MDQSGDPGDDYKFDQNQVFQASSHHNYKMIKASVLSGLDLNHNLPRGLRLMLRTSERIVIMMITRLMTKV